VNSHYTQIRLFDTLGRLIFEKEIRKVGREFHEEFILPEMSQGIYFLNIQNQEEKETKTVRFFKN